MSELQFLGLAGVLSVLFGIVVITILGMTENKDGSSFF